MATPQLTNDARKHIRYKAHDDIIVLSCEDACRLTDISEGGAAVTYINRRDIPPRFSIDIFMMSHKFNASVPVKLAWEGKVQFSPMSPIYTKSIGVEFHNLTEEMKSKIDYLIKIHQGFEA